MPDLPGCQIFTDGVCGQFEPEMPPSFVNRTWQTAPRGAEGWLPSFQDMGRLVAYAHQKYERDGNVLGACTVEVIAQTRDDTVKLTYSFNGEEQDTATRRFAPGDIKGPLHIIVTGSDGSRLELPEVDLAFNTHTPIKDRGGDYRNGQKGAIAEMFGWRHEDVEAECEMLGKAGYMGVKLFPANEQLMATQTFNGEMNPWYFMYQPVSYRLDGRMGTRAQLRSLIQTCRSHGVRVYADAVINHMIANGNDGFPQVHRDGTGACVKWSNKTSSGDFGGNGGPSPFFSQGFAYKYNAQTRAPPAMEFPAVPYGPTDFHCEKALNSWTDPENLNAGWLVGLSDLNTEKESVQERIAAYLTDLISIGFSGFRVDAAKHIDPKDLGGIFGRVRRNLGGALPADFISWLEVLTGGEKDLLMCQDSPYSFAGGLANELAANGLSQEEVLQVKIWFSGYPGDIGSDCGKLDRRREVIQNDDHDQQNPGSSSRSFNGRGSVLVKERDIPAHRGFEERLFSDPYEVSDNSRDWPIRMVLSSYYFEADGRMAPPDGLSTCDVCTTMCEGCKSVEYTPAHDPNTCGYDGPKYTRVHRDRAIIMAMREWSGLSTNVSNADIGLPDHCA